MHRKLLHDALQEEETRAMVVEADPEASEEVEENYAADFEEDYGQGHYKEDNEEEPERETPSPTGSEGQGTGSLPAESDTGGGQRSLDSADTFHLHPGEE
jgi:hypothetical protein